MDFESPEIEKATLEKITTAANRQLELEAQIEEQEEKLSNLNKDLAAVAGGYGVDGQIPGLMLEAGVEEITLLGGIRVKVSKELKAPSMANDPEKAPYREKVLNWADKSGNGGVIKDLVTIPFDKGDPKVVALVKYLDDEKILYDRFRSIHPQTLLALFREIIKSANEKLRLGKSLESRDTIPMEELGVQQFQKSKIERPKIKK